MDNEILVQQLEATGDYKVIRRFIAPDHYASLDGVDRQQLRIAMIIDTETTGLNKETDKIIDLGFVLAEFNAKTGQVHRIVERYSGFEDPGMPIPASITQLTGIQDADVAGQVLDEARVEAAIARASVVIAHNAAFDRGFLERRFPSFVSKWWACSQKEAPWQEMMTGSAKLEWLAYQLGGVFYRAHRALVDAEVLLFILTKTGPSARTILSHVLESSARRTFCVWAENAPFDKKDVLKKEKGYRWSDGSSAERPIKAWYKAGVVDLAAELAMLGAEVYDRPAQVTVDTISGRERYTERYLTRDKMPVAVP
ncbi:3'-5' exonuclease [Zoogloea oleivorans]|uniref:3'-5' exonuclease n=2 Tax=Zoogloea oleivorans TaxID=1552750 RepID=A0A6C2CMC8_9RHOO|nr:3'-5' exonuclease [Zoogloea oleivorans]